MYINDEEIIKGYTQVSKTNYGDVILKEENILDIVTFGYYAEDGSTFGELSIKWIKLNSNYVPKLEAYQESWRALISIYDLINNSLLNHKNHDITPNDFCSLLLDHGFKNLANIKLT